ncbi:MAG: phosphate signaling complex protein PhoU [Anaerolineales bacterium]|nr:MAG: phosphate signaling complex protein PhoU [Anaerolineales bacterium]
MGRETFERELQRLQDEVLALGSMVENALVESVDLLKKQDLDGARRLIAEDENINQKRFAIEAETLVQIATQQPMAGDLRILASILDIASELERIGDYGKGIAKVNLLIGNRPLVKPLIDLPRMAVKAADMLHRALEAFVRRDVDLARAIPKEDVDMDALYDQIYRELLTFIMSDPRTIDQATYLLWVGHNLERAADRVTNICERAVFVVTGTMEEMDREGRDVIGPEVI